MEALFIFPAIFAGAYYWYAKYIRIDALRKKKPVKVQSKVKKKEVEIPEYRCVAIEPGTKSCQAAKQLATHPILMNEAETLPLKACDAAACSCGYIRSDDRRHSARRRDLSSAEYFTAYRKNRRSEDRRKQTQTNAN